MHYHRRLAISKRVWSTKFSDFHRGYFKINGGNCMKFKDLLNLFILLCTRLNKSILDHAYYHSAGQLPN